MKPTSISTTGPVVSLDDGKAGAGKAAQFGAANVAPSAPGAGRPSSLPGHHQAAAQRASSVARSVLQGAAERQRQRDESHNANFAKLLAGISPLT